MKRLEVKHPVSIRWFHWLNVPLLGLMIWSGLLIYWAHPTYRIGLGELTLLEMNLETETWKSLGVNNRLAEGMALHFFFMWLFALNGLAYVLYVAFSGEWRELLPNRSSLRDAWNVLLHDLRIRREPLPRQKFNGAQRIAYTLIVILGFLGLLSGLAIYKPVQFSWLTALFGGYPMARFFHFWIAVSFIIFFVIHIAQVIRAGWNNFRAMVIGVELIDADTEATHDG